MADFFLTGGCLCGSIRYEITGPIIRSYACHCNFCKKATGAAFRSAIGVNRSSLKISGDTLSTYKHIISEHGRALWPSFCGRCGTGIGSTLERFPELQVINIGTLDKPEEIEVSMHYYSDEALPWICYNLTDTVFHEHRLNADDTLATPRKI